MQITVKDVADLIIKPDWYWDGVQYLFHSDTLDPGTILPPPQMELTGYVYNPDDGHWYDTAHGQDGSQIWQGPAFPDKEKELNDLVDKIKDALDQNYQNTPDMGGYLFNGDFWFNYNKYRNRMEREYIAPPTKTWWDRAKDWRPRIDPLTLDLDNDGLETVGTSTTNPILFDHDGDGTKNGTGWVASDDAMLVLDRNGNGTIDSGRELFGDNTIKSNGQTATDGFDALADLDSNADGIVNNQDAQFANLKLWRDLNQDGISQTGELFTLNELGIASINIASTANSQPLANGNQLTNTGIYTKADGTTGSIADINLADDTFHREFGNVLDTTTVASLPDMQARPEHGRRGSGTVRDLRKAANDGDWRVAA